MSNYSSSVVRKLISIGVVSALTLAFFPRTNHVAYSQAGSMTSGLQLSKNLSLGMTDAQVITLQKILNKDSSTQIAFTGSGSPGNETAYFGALTQKAVIKFQEKYTLDVLVPAGLSRGNGFVGPLTIKKLNAVSGLTASGQSATVNSVQNTQNTAINNDNSAVTATEKIDIYATDKKMEAIRKNVTDSINTAIASQKKPDVSSILPTSALSPVLLYRLSSNAGNVGTSLSITGLGFNNNNTIYFGSSYVVRNVSGINALSFKVPNIPPGRYDVVVKNSAGISNSQVFVVTSPSSPKVSLSQVTPTSITYGQTITVRGSGFTSTNNDIVTQFGIIKGVASNDGTTLSFTFKPEAFKIISTLGTQGKSYPVSVMVINDNGYATLDTAFKFTY